MTTNDQSCKPIQFTNFMKLRGTDKAYLEALEASSKFNRRLIVDRKTRIPFIDSQTRVAQTNSLVWYLRYQRENSDKNEQVYTYPVKNWVKKRRLQYDIDSNLIRLPSYEQSAQQRELNENSNSTDSLMQPMTRQSTILLDQDVIEQTQTPTSGSSSAQQQSQQQQQQLQQQQSSKYIDDWHMQDDSFDYYNDPPEHDNESDFDDYEEKKSKKKKGGKGTGKKRSEISNDEKPFVCDKCGVKYKTKPGLTYHVHKMHSANAAGGSGAADATATPQHDQVAQAIHSRVSSVTKMSECINSDENTNSLLDSAYDDSNHHNPPLQSASATSAQLKQPSVAGGSGASQANTKLCTNCGYGPLDQESKCLVSCCECTRSYHPICLNFSSNMISSVRKYNWQCIECKKCTICGNSENDDKLLFCDDCDRGYHMYCLNPPLSDAPAGDWRCDLCVQQFGPQ